MDILKTATEWAKAEIFSSFFFVLFGLFFLILSLGFWQIGKTELAKAFIIPTIIAGSLLMIIGIGLIVTNQSRKKHFPIAYEENVQAFLQSELVRAESTIKEYKTVVFTIIPLIIVAAAILIIVLDSSTWRAISITTIAMMIIILFIDSNASERMEVYNRELKHFISQINP